VSNSRLVFVSKDLTDTWSSGVKHLEALPSPTPAVNQIELHPFCQQKEIVKYCHDHGIVVEAYSPLVRASKEHLDHPAIQALCKKHAKAETQILLRWSLQKG
jgi:diketogulonate reductase-like aldo/keto reductase